MRTSEGVLGRINSREIFEARGVSECDIVKVGRRKVRNLLRKKRGKRSGEWVDYMLLDPRAEVVAGRSRSNNPCSVSI
jgi:hypothetical protein